VVPVGSFDGRPVVQPEHPITTRIQEAYKARTRAAEYRTELYIAVP
jgi:branched-chain amino acid aminotransferase